MPPPATASPAAAATQQSPAIHGLCTTICSFVAAVWRPASTGNGRRSSSHPTRLAAARLPRGRLPPPSSLPAIPGITYGFIGIVFCEFAGELACRAPSPTCAPSLAQARSPALLPVLGEHAAVRGAAGAAGPSPFVLARWGGVQGRCRGLARVGTCIACRSCSKSMRGRRARGLAAPLGRTSTLAPFTPRRLPPASGVMEVHSPRVQRYL